MWHEPSWRLPKKTGSTTLSLAELGKGGVRRLMLGSVSSDVVNRARCRDRCGIETTRREPEVSAAYIPVLRTTRSGQRADGVALLERLFFFSIHFGEFELGFLSLKFSS